MIPRYFCAALGFVLCATSLQSQAATARIQQDTSGALRAFSFFSPLSGAALVGLSVSSATSPRDTAGILITNIVPGSAAEKAGIIEGDRLAAINGVNLKVSAMDAGQSDMQGIMARRFQREINKVRAGDTLSLTVASTGRPARVVKVGTEAPARTAPYSRLMRSDDSNQPTLGAIVGGSPSARDTLGVFVTEIAEDGPLANAKVYEGSRIARIGSVDLRVPTASAGDAKASTEQVNKLLAEVGKLEIGSAVSLRVYDAGRFRDVQVTPMRRGDVDMPASVHGLLQWNRGGGIEPFILRGGGDEPLVLGGRALLDLPAWSDSLGRLRLDGLRNLPFLRIDTLPGGGHPNFIFSPRMNLDTTFWHDFNFRVDSIAGGRYRIIGPSGIRIDSILRGNLDVRIDTLPDGRIRQTFISPRIRMDTTARRPSRNSPQRGAGSVGIRSRAVAAPGRHAP